MTLVNTKYRKDSIDVKKRTLAILLVVLAVLAAIWVTNYYDAQNNSDAAVQAQPTSALALLDDVASDAPVQTEQQPTESQAQPEETQTALDEHGTYTTKEDVGLYLFTYGHLPENFMTKDEARALGWSGGGLDDYSYGMCIGGDRFGNNEGLLPEAGGRRYYECDIDTLHEDSRGAKRIVFSNDGLIYYTGDHYDSFELLYGKP